MGHLLGCGVGHAKIEYIEMVKCAELGTIRIPVRAAGPQIQVLVADAQGGAHRKVICDQIGQVGGKFHDLQLGVHILILGILFLVVDAHARYAIGADAKPQTGSQGRADADGRNHKRVHLAVGFPDPLAHVGKIRF